MRSRAICSSRAFRHLHDTHFEEVQHIDRRPGDSHNLMCHLASGILSVIDAARQDDFYSPIIEVPSFYEAYLRKISVMERLSSYIRLSVENTTYSWKAEVCPHWLPNRSTATEALQLECNGKGFKSVVSFNFSSFIE